MPIISTVAANYGRCMWQTARSFILRAASPVRVWTGGTVNGALKAALPHVQQHHRQRVRQTAGHRRGEGSLTDHRDVCADVHAIAVGDSHGEGRRRGAGAAGRAAEGLQAGEGEGDVDVRRLPVGEQEEVLPNRETARGVAEGQHRRRVPAGGRWLAIHVQGNQRH